MKTPGSEHLMQSNQLIGHDLSEYKANNSYKGSTVDPPAFSNPHHDKNTPADNHEDQLELESN